MSIPRRPMVFALAALGLAGLAAGLLAPGLIHGARGRAVPGAFQVEPYLQPGDDPGGPVALLWQTGDETGKHDGSWWVHVRADGDPPTGWVPTDAPTSRLIATDGLASFRLYRVTLPWVPDRSRGLTYRVRHMKPGEETEFTAAIPPSPREKGRPDRVVIFGDCAAGSAGQRAIAVQVARAKPDYVVLTGDVVYSRGRVSEYLDHYFPVYNADRAGADVGAPLLRSTVFYAAPGNHDLIEADLDRYPDGLAYFYYWDQPLNGPLAAPEAVGAPRLKGSPARRKAFLDAAGPAYPRMTNFSFDRGGVHWTVLDANTYTDWTDPTLRAWLEADLASPAAREAAWRFVAMHHPPFHSSKAHGEDQRMRLLAPVFEKAGVSVVFSGHVHNYQRSRPLRFVPGPPPADGRGKPYGPHGQVNGRWVLDTSFDGASHTRPDGVVYIVTGAGGARLYNPEQHDRPDTWHDYTARFVSDVHSLTLLDVTPFSLALRQVAADGHEVDRVLITR